MCGPGHLFLEWPGLFCAILLMVILYIEERNMANKTGRLITIWGPMFGGKTDRMIFLLRRAVIAGKKVMVFKHAFDTERYSKDAIASHSGGEFKAVPISKASDILDLIPADVNVVAIDEAQFFEADIIRVVFALVQMGKKVIVAGLALDFKKDPFGQMPKLVLEANKSIQVKAICPICGKKAIYTQRLIDGKPAYDDDPVIKVGADESYEPRCRKHHEVLHRS
jgi:thymidine kinase